MELSPKSIAVSVLSVAIMVMLVVTVLVPSISDVGDITITNTAESQLYNIDDSEPVHFVIADGVYTINDVVTTNLNSGYSTVSSDGLILRWQNASTPTVQYLTSEGTWTGDYANSLDLVAQNGHITGTVGSTQIDSTYSFLYYQGDGNYIVTSGGSTFYVNEETPITCTGYQSSIGSSAPYRFFIMEGSIKDGFTCRTTAGTELTFNTINYTKVNGYEDLYSVSSIIFDADNGAQLTINRCIIPEQIDAKAENHAVIDSLISIVPMVILIGLIIGTVGAFISRRD